jgi:hypothetical protein
MCTGRRLAAFLARPAFQCGFKFPDRCVPRPARVGLVRCSRHASFGEVVGQLLLAPAQLFSRREQARLRVMFAGWLRPLATHPPLLYALDLVRIFNHHKRDAKSIER